MSDSATKINNNVKLINKNVKKLKNETLDNDSSSTCKLPISNKEHDNKKLSRKLKRSNSSHSSLNLLKFKTLLKRSRRNKNKPIKEEIPKVVERRVSQIKICITGTRYEVFGRIAKLLNWKCVREKDLWNIYWTDSILGVEFCKSMKRFQKINHFPGMYEICRKDLLARNLNRMLNLFPNDYQFFPKTWCFPADLGDAIQYCKTHRNKAFILKPDQGAQGRGISLTKTLKDIKPTDRMICQLYINQPLLIDGFKFDLRVYTLITSIDPLRIYVYNEGLVRFATSHYVELGGHNTTNLYMHLTNYSVNKHSRTFSNDVEAGSKRTFSSLNKLLTKEGYNVQTLWNSIDDIIIKTILSAWPMLKHNYNVSFSSHDITQGCFEILGIDIILDENFKPYILEVNHSPSFHTGEQVDKDVKTQLILDTFAILNINVDDKRKVIDEDKQRIKDRLLCKNKNQLALYTVDDTDDSAIIDTVNKSTDIPNDPVKNTMNNSWAQQILWEENHLGNYRRVLPVPGDTTKYTKFFLAHTQSSVYFDTITSKKREEAAKEIRSILAEKAKNASNKLDNVVTSSSVISGESKTKKKKNKLLRSSYSCNSKDQFASNHINDCEEKDRQSGIIQRNVLIRNSGLLRYVYTSFYVNNLLRDNDRKFYEKYQEQLPTELAFEPIIQVNNSNNNKHDSTNRISANTTTITKTKECIFEISNELPQSHPSIMQDRKFDGSRVTKVGKKTKTKMRRKKFP